MKGKRLQWNVSALQRRVLPRNECWGVGNPISAPVMKSQIDAFCALNHRKKICLRKCVKAKDPELCYRITELMCTEHQN